MKNSSIIALIVLLIGVSVLIWVGAFSGSGIDNMDKDDNKPTGTVISDHLSETKKPEPTPSATEKPVATPTPIGIDTITVSTADFLKYNNDFQYWDSYYTMDPDENQNYPYIKTALVDAIGDAQIIPKVIKTVSVDGADRHEISNKHIENEAEVYLTFSLAYDAPAVVEQVLDILDAKNVKATFFMTEYYILAEGNADIIKRIYTSGHLIGTRGPDYEDFLSSCNPESFAKHMKDTEKAFRSIVEDENARMLFYRPERFSERTLMVAQALGYTNVFRTFMTYGGNNWLNDIKNDEGKIDEDLACTKMFERGSYDGSVPDITFAEMDEADIKTVISAFDRYIDEAKGANITFKLLNQ